MMSSLTVRGEHEGGKESRKKTGRQQKMGKKAKYEILMCPYLPFIYFQRYVYTW